MRLYLKNYKMENDKNLSKELDKKNLLTERDKLLRESFELKKKIKDEKKIKSKIEKIVFKVSIKQKILVEKEANKRGIGVSTLVRDIVVKNLNKDY